MEVSRWGFNSTTCGQGVDSGMPTPRRLHRVLGLILVLPLLGWALTGLVFFIKPGYGAAYSPLPVRTYPLDAMQLAVPDSSWRELRQLRTVLGLHLLVRDSSGWRQLDPETGAVRPAPDEAGLSRLAEDAFARDSVRYGTIASVEGNTIRTSTGATVKVDWDRLAFSQEGRDTRLIDGLYRVHYLQWTGIGAVDRILGILGLAGIAGLAGLGVWLAVRGPK